MRAGGGAANDAADFGRAGEGDLVHVGMVNKRGTGAAITGDDIHHPRRQADAGADFGEQQRGERGQFGGLQHHRVAHGNGGGDFPRQHQQRKIPRDDLADDAERLMVRHFAVGQLRPAGVVIKVARDQRNIDVAGFADRLAVVHGFQHRKQARVFLNLPGDGVQVAGADVPRRGRP